jgi:putative phage-type endonuclease
VTEALIQGSQEWLAARLGRVTASRVRDVVAKTKSGPSASRANYMAELVAERLTGAPAERYQNDAMRWGSETEPQARDAYCFLYDVDVVEVGFVQHPRIEMTGASPDGLVGDVGMIEIKCPNTATHIETLTGGIIDPKYVVQMQWQMACADRAWCDFASFDPRLPAEMQLFVQRVHRDNDHIAELEREVSTFLAELDAKVAQLRALYERKAA